MARSLLVCMLLFYILGVAVVEGFAMIVNSS